MQRSTKTDTQPQPRLWTRNFTLVTVATVLGAAGGIAGDFALSFLVFDETGSTLASALVMATSLLPFTFVPLVLSPVMDRLPRKAFLVGGDAVNGVAYALLGLWLLKGAFSYEGYLLVALVLASLGSVDELAYNSFYPELIPKGCEQRGYAVSGMLYPALIVVMTPLAAVLLDTVGIPFILIMQGVLSVAAALVESLVRVPRRQDEANASTGVKSYSLSAWVSDLRESLSYLQREPGVSALFGYSSVSNAVATGYSTIMVAFFRTTPGLTVAMYGLFAFTECIGRTVGGALQYRFEIAPRHRFGFCFFVYQLYELFDMCLLWLPYPLMLANRTICGFFGANSRTLRVAAIQSYIPEQMRARINAAEGILYTAAAAVFSLLAGALGEVLDLRWCMTICGTISLAACWLFVWGHRKAVRTVFEA